MAKYRAIPVGFMTVGEAARKMGVTVRTLQYYDKEGLFSGRYQTTPDLFRDARRCGRSSYGTGK